MVCKYLIFQKYKCYNYFFVFISPTELNFTEIVELLHVPLQNLYKNHINKIDLTNNLENGQIYQNNNGRTGDSN